jgi:hypothetical protein
MYRQGDILIVESAIPKDALSNKLEHKILARGEATGHAHVLDGDVQLYESNQGTFFESFADVPLIHEEHETIVIPEGSYQVVRQREFDGEQIRYVYD